MARVINLEQEKIVQCKYCKKMVKYEDSDLKGDSESGPFGTTRWTYVTCPNCGHQIQF